MRVSFPSSCYCPVTYLVKSSCWAFPHPEDRGGSWGSFLGQFGQASKGGFSFQADETAEGVSVPALLADVLCRNVGVHLAEAHAVDVGELYRGLVEVGAVALPTVAVRGCLNGVDQTWLLVHVPVLSGPEDMWVGSLDECCSLVWGRTLVEMCDLEACWEG